MPENSNVYIFLRDAVKNITTPYEYHQFEKVFSFELAQLNSHQYDEIMAMYERKKSVLMQETVRAENVMQVGMYYLYQAFTDDKRITQMAEKLYSMLDYYQEKADENGISLYEQLMREYGSQYFFEFKIRILPPKTLRELSPPVGLVKKREEEEVEEEEEKQKGKEELPVVAIPPEIIERLNSIEEELQKTNEKINDVFSNLVEKINTAQKQTTPQGPVKPTTTRHRERRKFSDEVIGLYKRYVGISMNDINLAVFAKFIETIKQLYHRKAVEMKDLQAILDEVDFGLVRTAIVKRKSISEAYSEALKDLVSKIRPDTTTEEEKEYEEAREESGVFDKYGERINVLVDQLQDLIDDYRIAKEQNDVGEVNNVREIMKRMFYVETDEDFREAVESPYEYITKRWDMFFR